MDRPLAITHGPAAGFLYEGAECDVGMGNAAEAPEATAAAAAGVRPPRPANWGTMTKGLIKTTLETARREAKSKFRSRWDLNNTWGPPSHYSWLQLAVGPYFTVKGLIFFRYFAGKGAKLREHHPPFKPKGVAAGRKPNPFLYGRSRCSRSALCSWTRHHLANNPPLSILLPS